MSNDDDVDDWRELMPDHEDERFSGIYDAVELALYADPDEFTIRQGIYVAYAFLLGPMLLLAPLALVGLVATGQLTLDQILGGIEAARATSSTTPLFEFDPVAFGRSMLAYGLVIPFSLGIAMLVKTVLKALAVFREVRR